MGVAVKICGINAEDALEEAIGGGATYVGFVFFPRSPRYVSPARAAELTQAVSGRAERVGILVDPDDALLDSIFSVVTLDLLQLHGDETPDRVVAVRRRFGVPVIKAIKVGTVGDLATAAQYRNVADRLMFDGKAPRSMAGAMPGGNRVSFDWPLLRGRDFGLPWILSGGLDPTNVAEAIRASGADAVDVSSGVEDGPGHKDTSLIAAFLAAAKLATKKDSSWQRQKRA
ncbi:MAG: phosphoribosylanthranilate isomerase [Alphaproteobacteria bacterium]|nr:phosphoribosylanthranilate isomerase [Alphaproteobacteria bacterium]